MRFCVTLCTRYLHIPLTSVGDIWKGSSMCDQWHDGEPHGLCRYHDGAILVPVQTESVNNVPHQVQGDLPAQHRILATLRLGIRHIGPSPQEFLVAHDPR